MNKKLNESQQKILDYMRGNLVLVRHLRHEHKSEPFRFAQKIYEQMGSPQWYGGPEMFTEWVLDVLAEFEDHEMWLQE